MGGAKKGSRRAQPAPRPPASRLRPILLIAPVMIAAALFAAWFLLLRSAPAQTTPAHRVIEAPADSGVRRLVVRVVSSRPHDPAAFTQGLVLDQGTLYESTGLYGQSSLRQVDPKDGRILRKVDVPARYFAEGLALVGEKLVQLTWQEQAALLYKRASFDRAGELAYQGEGWGLCYDGQSLVMSDGSDRLTFRDPETFALRRELHVRLGPNPMDRLNELECVQGKIYANVWQTEEILEIDPATGKVEAVIDASGLLSPQERNGTDVLNGIAYDPAAGTFLITGKLWPKLFEVRFVTPGS